MYVTPEIPSAVNATALGQLKLTTLLLGVFLILL